MTVRVSQKMSVDDDNFYVAALLSYDGRPISLPDKFHPNSAFLAYHRKHIFEKRAYEHEYMFSVLV